MCINAGNKIVNNNMVLFTVLEKEFRKKKIHVCLKYILIRNKWRYWKSL